MSTTQYLLFSIFMLLSLGAVICFSLFVIKPLQTRWAIIRARKIVASGHLPNNRHSRSIYRMLATARNDLEATKLWRQMDELKEKPPPITNGEFRQLVAIIPPGGKIRR